MEDSLSQKLIHLADTYETKSFLEKDPSQFMHNYTDTADMEVAAFIAANLAFGRRDQILVHVRSILDAAGSSPSQWIRDGRFTDFFLESDTSFYRMFSHRHMRLFCATLQQILQAHDSLGSFFQQQYTAQCKMHNACMHNAYTHPNTPDKNSSFLSAHSGAPLLSSIISDAFPAQCPVVAHGKDSACKKIHMFLRWMVRDNSPIDVGLWSHWYKKTDLLMPLDTHVMQQSARLGLLPLTKAGTIPAASLKTAVILTDAVREAFPDDPVRADFALFGMGVDK
ncbi:MAG: TIGR02757 family protein [Treponema sp.]|nr:TIGR02757 family protein [Treponema sp.]